MKPVPDPSRRSFWLKQLHQWHWISSALCLIGMLLFAATGITLNHAGQIEAKPTVVSRKGQLPPPLIARLAAGKAEGKAPAPPEVAAWVETTLAVDIRGREAEWSDGELYVALARPGGDAWLSIDRDTGAVEYEKTTRGAISLINDLHKGRNTGPAWGWFIDVFAVACLVFCLTGLFLLQFHARARPLTWPMVAAGLVIPLLLVILFVHL
ncbi:MAG: PepSY-associated helix domain protein [Caulobacter sp.]|nr:PepSY-associated helix domain protein [Caulobacter sp.]